MESGNDTTFFHEEDSLTTPLTAMQKISSMMQTSEHYLLRESQALCANTEQIGLAMAAGALERSGSLLEEARENTMWMIE
jgi:hypothetical protein